MTTIHRLSVALGPLGRPMAGARWLPLYANLEHVGRTSGRRYTTPVVARPTRDGFVVPLPFGDQTQWIRNIEAAGVASLRHRGQTYQVSQPVVVAIDDVAVEVGRPISALARAIGIRRWVRLERR